MTRKEISFTPQTPPVIYFLRKIHKTPHQLRPTHNLSTFLDFFFKPLLPQIPAYQQSSRDLMEILKATPLSPHPQILLVTVDINAMYPSIPQEEGITSLLEYNTLSPFPNMVATRLLNFILKENYSTFAKQFYQQISGVAMGTPIAPTFANFFMAHLEDSFFTTQTLLPLIYKRYIDDIFILCDSWC